MGRGGRFYFKYKIITLNSLITIHIGRVCLGILSNAKTFCDGAFTIVLLLLVVVVVVVVVVVSSSLSPLYRVFIHIFLRQTISLENTVFQLFCHYYLWCLYC